MKYFEKKDGIVFTQIIKKAKNGPTFKNQV